MWGAVATILMGFFFALVTSQMTSPDIHFDYTTGDCGDNSTVASQCSGMYQQSLNMAVYFNEYTVALDCRLMTETIACIETALCHCNFSGDHPQLEVGYRSNMILYHYYNNITGCDNTTYGESIGSTVFGPIDNTQGVNCTQYNRTAGDLALTLAVSELAAVQEVEDLCAGVKECYATFDRGLELALYNTDWPQFCAENAVLLECLVNASCSCGQSAHQLVVNMVTSERDIYRQSCAAIVRFGTITEIGIRCPGADLCDSPDPSYDCLKEFEATAAVAQTNAQYCTTLFALANCTERVACDCGFYQEPGYYRSLAISKHNYITTNNCEDLTGKFPNHTSLNCGIDNRFTDAEKILSIALAEPEFVASEEATCPGIGACYDTANTQSAEAYRMKDLTSICLAESELIACIEEAYCECGRLNQKVVYDKLYELRFNQANLCQSVTDFPDLTRCRGLSTCQQNDPLNVCTAEYRYDSRIADQNYELQCQATKNYIVCAEVVGCRCGFLRDATSAGAELIYNLTTLSTKVYADYGCPRLSGGIINDESGIQCAEPNNNPSSSKKLALNFADSAEVAALTGECDNVTSCFADHDGQRASALVSRSYVQLCRAQTSLVACLDKAYCECRLNGTQGAENYINTMVTSHLALCENVDGAIQREPCNYKGPTGSSNGVHSLPWSCLFLLLLTVAIVL